MGKSVWAERKAKATAVSRSVLDVHEDNYEASGKMKREGGGW